MMISMIDDAARPCKFPAMAAASLGMAAHDALQGQKLHPMDSDNPFMPVPYRSKNGVGAEVSWSKNWRTVGLV
jgi:hypothetical protein